MGCFNHKGGCGIRECMRIEAFKTRTGLGYIDKRLWLIINAMLFKTVIPLRI